MELLPYIVAYLAIIVFVVAVVARFIMWTSMPMHVRWELYPVAHEAKKAHYGGSYLEEKDWWTKPRETSLFGELKVMIPEILFLVAVKESNPKLWIRSFPFHFGLYLLIGCVGSMFLMNLLGFLFPLILVGALGTLLHYSIIVLGVGGLLLGTFGSLGLLQRRLTDHGMKDFSAPSDIFNLLFFIVTFSVGLGSFFMVDSDFSRLTFLVNGLMTFQMTAIPGTGAEVILPSATLILFSLLMAYIPLTHMSHFIGKYFAYHSIRWNDKPNLKGGDEEATIGGNLNRPVSWAAPHIKGDGKTTWADVATDLSLLKENGSDKEKTK